MYESFIVGPTLRYFRKENKITKWASGDSKWASRESEAHPLQCVCVLTFTLRQRAIRDGEAEKEAHGEADGVTSSHLLPLVFQNFSSIPSATHRRFPNMEDAHARSVSEVAMHYHLSILWLRLHIKPVMMSFCCQCRCLVSLGQTQRRVFLILRYEFLNPIEILHCLEVGTFNLLQSL